MKVRIISIGVVLICAFTSIIQAQYPNYFQITTEEGLPSNEVYSLVEDAQGFIWLGCDAGLFKYDGIRFIPFKNKNLQSKSISGLTVSKSGRIYCYTFKGQLFFVENNKLVELKHPCNKISHLVCDENSKLWVNHFNGLSVFDEKKNEWISVSDFPYIEFKNTNNGCLDSEGTYWFIHSGGVTSIKNNHNVHYDFDFVKNGLLSGTFFLSINLKGEKWIISNVDGKIFQLTTENKFVPVEKNEIIDLLNNRKITNIIQQNQHETWICTYTGIIKCDFSSKKNTVLYPHLAVSNCITDAQGNTWVSTLQNGILRIPNLQNQIWNAQNFGLNHDLLNKINGNKTQIFFSSLDGYIGQVDCKTGKLTQVKCPIEGDIQQIYYDTDSDQLLYTINNVLYSFKNEQHTIVNKSVFPLKSMLKIDQEYFLATSFGCFSSTNLNDFELKKNLTSEWSRTLNWLPKSQSLWVGTNNGLLLFSKQKGKWDKKGSALDSVQIISSTIDSLTETLFRLTFNGELFSLDKNANLQLVSRLNEPIQGHQIVYFDNQIYVATNQGIWIWHLVNKTWSKINKNSGLASNNIQGIFIQPNFIWLATGNGLQKLPLSHASQVNSKATIYLKQVLINGEKTNAFDGIQMYHNQSLSFSLESTNYYSNDQFNYAYRITTIDTNWIVFPGTIEQIDILKLPSGPFEIEIKSIDVFGNDSKNVLILKGYVAPPFWQKWWFYVLIGSVVLFFSWLLFKFRISRIRVHQQLEIERIQLENKLRLTQQSALKAQMNPHFLFNVLNSIKGFIYENDKKNAVNYLNNFSELVRKVLTLSSLPTVRLTDEIEVLELYIHLEAMLLQGEFEFIKKIDSDLDTDNIEIPSLIIQPYIENAFKHGLRHKTGKKELQLNMYLDSLESDVLVVEIRDNGIGRKASQEINLTAATQHTSFATAANEKRIDLLNYKKSGIIGVTVVDLTLEENNITGTHVLLKIHLQNDTNK